jgi:hypothetical protein
VIDIRYLCPFVTPAGEIRDVIVMLSLAEIADVLRQRILGRDAGSAHGPLERAYAWARAAREVPPSFTPLYTQDRRVMVH